MASTVGKGYGCVATPGGSLVKVAKVPTVLSHNTRSMNTLYPNMHGVTSNPQSSCYVSGGTCATPATNLSKFAKQIQLKVLVGSERYKNTASANLDKSIVPHSATATREEMMLSRGLNVDHTTVYRWVRFLCTRTRQVLSPSSALD